MYRGRKKERSKPFLAFSPSDSESHCLSLVATALKQAKQGSSNHSSGGWVTGTENKGSGCCTSLFIKSWQTPYPQLVTRQLGERTATCIENCMVWVPGTRSSWQPVTNGNRSPGTCGTSSLTAWMTVQKAISASVWVSTNRGQHPGVQGCLWGNLGSVEKCGDKNVKVQQNQVQFFS